MVDCQLNLIVYQFLWVELGEESVSEKYQRWNQKLLLTRI